MLSLRKALQIVLFVPFTEKHTEKIEIHHSEFCKDGGRRTGKQENVWEKKMKTCQKNIIRSCNKFHLRFSLYDNLKYLWCLRNFYFQIYTYFVSR